MIERLLEDPSLRTRLGDQGKARAAALCDPETQIAAIAQAIAQTIASLPNRKAA
jgi:hypothetical protein